MTKWEYSVQVVSCAARELEARLNAFGADGWEVFQVRRLDGGGQEVLMRRPGAETRRAS